jgi:hypothetical protein
MIKLLSKLESIILVLISWMVLLFLMTYCEDLAKHILPLYSYFKLPLTMLFLVPSFLLTGYLLLYAYLFVRYTIGFLFHNHVYVPLFVPAHKTTRSYKFHKRIGMEHHYWHRVTGKFYKE